MVVFVCKPYQLGESQRGQRYVLRRRDVERAQLYPLKNCVSHQWLHNKSPKFMASNMMIYHVLQSGAAEDIAKPSSLPCLAPGLEQLGPFPLGISLYVISTHGLASMMSSGWRHFLCGSSGLQSCESLRETTRRMLHPFLTSPRGTGSHLFCCSLYVR